MPASTESIKESVTSVLESVHLAGAEFAGALGGMDGAGWSLSIILLAIMACWHIIESMLDKNKNLTATLTRLALMWAIVASLLTGWSEEGKGVGLTGATTVAGFFTTTLPSITESFTDGKDPTDVVVGEYASAIIKVIAMDTSTDRGDNRDAVEKTLTFLADIGTLGLHRFAQPDGAVAEGGWASQILSFIVVQIMLLVAAIFVVWSLVSFVYMLNVGDIMIYVGLAIGPIMVPFLLIPALSFLFSNWLRFMINAAFLKIVAVIVALIILKTIEKIVYYADNFANQTDSFIFLGLMIVFYSVLARQLMDRADNMASSLAGGGATIGGSNIFGGLVASTAASTPRVASGIYQAGKSTVNGVKSLMGKNTEGSGGGGDAGSKPLGLGAAGNTAAKAASAFSGDPSASAFSELRSKMAQAKRRNNR